MALRDVRFQLEIDTGMGMMCPVTDDYFVTADAMKFYAAYGLDFDALAKESVTDIGAAIAATVRRLAQLSSGSSACKQRIRPPASMEEFSARLHSGLPVENLPDPRRQWRWQDARLLIDLMGDCFSHPLAQLAVIEVSQ